ncbi:small integral membrane protein 20 isoform X2 [Brienomyrus brachyistius]|uniref:small integral membrane protein 20 isoform X2 n=1 Tax=Brienomyrus brachyistius TaxID=42636 RepID=UPI0020B2BEC6|nr:small integral membrane protein 20 isoform X2 [Brienomyrus brachyistius]
MGANRRIAIIFGGFITAVAAAFYPIFFYPLAHLKEYNAGHKSCRNQPSRSSARWCESMV